MVYLYCSASSYHICFPPLQYPKSKVVLSQCITLHIDWLMLCDLVVIALIGNKTDILIQRYKILITHWSHNVLFLMKKILMSSIKCSAGDYIMTRWKSNDGWNRVIFMLLFALEWKLVDCDGILVKKDCIAGRIFNQIVICLLTPRYLYR